MNELEVLKAVVVEAGKAVLELYNQDYNVDYKNDKSPVTAADLKSEEVIFKGLQQFGYPILSEESVDDFERLQAKRVWIVDPLDGTKDFIQKTGDFTIMVGLIEKGRPIAGGVYQPTKDRLFYAEKGQGAYMEQKGEISELNVSKRFEFFEVRMLVSRNHILEMEKNLSEKLGIVNLISCGSAGLKISLVASGKADLYINSSDKTSEWDICAGEIILEEAGGRITDLNGRQILYNKENVRNLEGYLVTNGIIHRQVATALEKYHQKTFV